MAKGGGVRVVVGAAGGDAVGQDAELAAADGGEEVREAVVVADLDVLVVRRGLAGLGGEVAAVGEALRGAPDRRSEVVGWVGELYGSAAAAGL